VKPVSLEAQMITLVEALSAQDGAPVSPIGAALLAAGHLEVAHDTRSFAAKLEMSHAIVLREAVALNEAGILDLNDRNERSSRVFFKPSTVGQKLLSTCEAV
jgi:hypothetical protein